MRDNFKWRQVQSSDGIPAQPVRVSEGVEPEVRKPILAVERLCVSVGATRLVQDVSFTVWPGETLALVGETGSGKTVTARAVLGLVESPLTITGGSIVLSDRNVLALSQSEMRNVRGREIAMIFQNPQASLHPMRRIRSQIAETIREHSGASKREAIEEGMTLLERLRLPEPERVMRSYPHQLSGGMCQRVMIALAIVSRPKLLIADEPTTALDTVNQAHILGLLKSLCGSYVGSLLFITHDLRIVAKIAERTAVVREGQIVEQARTAELFERPTHSYTRDLVQAARGRGVSVVEAGARV